MAATTATQAAATGGVWQTMGEWASTAGKWISDTAVKVGQFASKYFQIALEFVSKHDTAFIWGAIGAAGGIVATAVISFFCYGEAKDAGDAKGKGTPKGGVELPLAAEAAERSAERQAVTQEAGSPTE